MHAFVAAILLRLARLDAFDGDPETKPPNRELAQTEECMRARELAGFDQREIHGVSRGQI
jgi:hypothetical protein